MGKNKFSLEISSFSLALQPEALLNTSGQVLFSSPDFHKQKTEQTQIRQLFLVENIYTIKEQRLKTGRTNGN